MFDVDSTLGPRGIATPLTLNPRFNQPFLVLVTTETEETHSCSDLFLLRVLGGGRVTHTPGIGLSPQGAVHPRLRVAFVKERSPS